MAEINLSSDELTVLGGPSSVSVETSIGKAGDRGTYIMHGFLNPNDENASFSSDPQVFDMYIVKDPASADYLQMFQYVSLGGSLVWDPVVNLTTFYRYSTNRLLQFNSNQANLNLNIFEAGLFDLGTEFETYVNTKYYFNVQATPIVQNGENHNISLTVSVGDIDENLETGEYYVPLTFYGVTDNDGDYVIVSITIEIVDPNPVMDALGLGNS